MKRLNENEMKKINAGATYEATCSNGCGYKVTTYYWGWSSLSLLFAKVIADGLVHNHFVHCNAKGAGL